MATESKNIVIKANNNFIQKVYKNLISSSTSNTVVSPFSIHLILGLVSYGADNETKAQLLKGLGFVHSKDLLDNYKQILVNFKQCTNTFSELRVVDKIFVVDNFKINPTYQNIAQKYFLSEVSSIDFLKSAEAANTINKWVEHQTNNRIADIIDADSIHSLTRIILINAIYFKDTWAEPFFPESTCSEPFYTDDINSYNVQMMHKQCFCQLYDDGGKNGFYVLGLKYANTCTSMYIILSKEREGLVKLQDHLFESGSDFSETFDKIISGSRDQEVKLSLPKFKIESTWNLQLFCEAIGMKVMFTDNADFSNIFCNDEPLKPFKVDGIVQKAFIDVNEKGTEAAAVTRVQMWGGGGSYSPEKPKIIKVDHPFIYLIRNDYDGSILFIGAVKNPERAN